MKKPIAKLTGSNIIEHIKAIQEMDDQTHRYYCSDSELFKAIKDHIATADRDKDCALLDLKAEEAIPWHRGTGPSISFRKAFVYYGDDNTYVLNIEISFIYTEDSYQDYPPEHSRKYEIKVPIDLEINFTKEAFDKWIAEIYKNKLEKKNNDEYKKLEELIKKFPKEAMNILRNER